MRVYGEMKETALLSVAVVDEMYSLMCQFYNHMVREAFLRDLSQKDCAVLLWGEDDRLQGFSTQMELRLHTPQGAVRGVFSGDTIIHPESWGSMELFRLFAQRYFVLDREGDPFYWFLISKGYKTYKILPTFLREFYPRHSVDTPVLEQQIMDAFGAQMYPESYNPRTGVVEYRSRKDSLKEGVADLAPRHRKDPDVRFFLERNPGYAKGNDLVCIARLSDENLTPRTKKLLFGEQPC